MSDPLVSTAIERRNGSVIVHLRGEIDLSNCDRLQHQLENVLDDSPSVVLDLTEIAYLDSQGLRLIKQLANRAGGAGSGLQLVAPPDGFARQVLEMAQMSDYIQIRDTLDD